jgi:type VI secretion system protein ImpL
VQVILIALVLLLWPLGFLLRHYRGQRAEDQAGQAAEAPPEAMPKGASNRPSRQYKNLESGAIETVEFLRRNRAVDARGGDAIYGLPWFVIAGPPSSGKTSLMLSAGLSFNALESQRRADQDLLRPTRDCDWRVTDDAVLIDTAGRFQTEGAEDRDEWLGLVDALRKHRRERPLDGMVIAVSAADILSMRTAPEIRQQAQVLRARLNELQTGVAMQFPVYLVFTRADALPGFADFFGALGPDERLKVWGATIPLKDREKAHALFDTEFDYLLDSLMQRRLPRLGASGIAKTGSPREPIAREQLGVFDFPLHFNAARQKLAEFTTALFSPNPFSELPLLRGIYFTCSPAGQTAESGESTEVRIRHKGVFAEEFFKQVLLRDRHVAASLQAEHGRPNRARKLAVAAALLGAFCLLLLIGMLLSYFNNRALVADGKQAGADLLRHFKPPEGGAAPPLTQVEADDLGRLQDLLMRLDEYDESWFGSLSHRFGLYQGERLKPRLREIYFDFVSQRLLQPALDGLGQRLDQTALTATQSTEFDAEQDYYDKLKAYKMVERQERIEPVFLQNQLAEFWREGSTSEKRHLAYYAKEASLSGDDDGSIPRPLVPDDRVKNARDKLRNYAAAKQVYNAIMTDIERHGPPYYLRDVAQGQRGSEWFEDINSPSVPYRFTKQAYYKHVKGDGLLDVLGELRAKNQNDWVLDRAADYQRIEPKSVDQRYQNDYVAAWKKFLEGMRVKKFEKRSDAIQALDEFSQPNSPFATVIEQVIIQTKLAEPPVSGGISAWIKSWFTRKGAGGTSVEKSFAALNGFKMESYTAALARLKEAVGKARGEDWMQAASLKDDPDYQKAREGLRSVLSPLKGQPGSEAAAVLLAAPLDNMEIALGRGVERDRNSAWAGLVNTAQQLEVRYPFAGGSGVQVQPNELADYLNRLKQFSDQHLKDSLSFDPASCQMNVLRNDSFAQPFTDYLKDMCRVRASLMPTGQLGFSYSVVVEPPPGQSAEVRIDGTPIRAEGGRGSGSPRWPASGQENGVKAGLIQNGQFSQAASSDGPWGIFKLVGRSGGARTQVNLSGIRLVVESPGVNNPFQLEFSRYRAPKSITQ